MKSTLMSEQGLVHKWCTVFVESMCQPKESMVITGNRVHTSNSNEATMNRTAYVLV